MIELTQAGLQDIPVDWLVVVTGQSDQPAEVVDSLDKHLDDKLSAVWSSEEFSGEYASSVCIRQTREIAAVNVMLVGIGELGKLTTERLRRSLMTGVRRISVHSGQQVAIAFDGDLVRTLSADQLIEACADCGQLASIDASVYKKSATRHELSDLLIALSASNEQAEQRIQCGNATGRAVAQVRNLVNRTADDLTPTQFVAECRAAAETHGLEIRVLEREELVQERMHALLAVAKGSNQPPALVQLSWNGAPGSKDRLGLVGKGVTFDSGGLSIKPSDSMIAMKSDMAGAATAMAAVCAVAEMQLPINVTATLGLVENMINGLAFRPGDVIKSRIGTTIEVQNTDAEGRLLLADALAFAADQGSTRLIDLATLTGACVVALGEEITGMFPGCDQLAEQLQQAADDTGELLWPMPMHDHFSELLKSDVADCRNIGPRWGGAVTAACFLRKFVGETPWVHLDIAGPSWGDSKAGWRDSGGTGAVVRTLVQLMRNRVSETSNS